MKTEGTSAITPGSTYTIADRNSWPPEERWELIHGVPYAMSPAPRVRHQRLLLNLATQLRNALMGHPCEPFIAPVDVYLAPAAASARNTTE